MGKITINLTRSEQCNRKLILNSSRNYQNIFAACSGSSQISEEVYHLITKFQSSVVSLTLFSMNLSENFAAKALLLPRLKLLKLTKPSPNACGLVLSPGCNVENFLFQPATSSEDLNGSLEKFLFQQRDKLEIIEIIDLPSERVLELIINNLTKLMNLRVKKLLRDERKLELKPNPSITTLALNGLSIERLRNCILNTPELNTLMLSDHKLTRELLEFLAVNMGKLRKLFYWTIADNCLEHYQQMKATRNVINTQIEIKWMLASLRRS